MLIPYYDIKYFMPQKLNEYNFTNFEFNLQGIPL